MNEVREEVYSRDNHTCQYCHGKKQRSQLTLEHIAPVNERGIDDIANFITACRSGNSSKQDKPLSEFLEDKDVEVTDLPIHGDIILDTPELPDPYRKIRRETYYEMRREGKLTGGDAFKKLEKKFRRRLWETDYGQTLAKRYPRLPGHTRASVPLVEYLVPDPRKPIHGVLIEFTKSASTRYLIDEMLRKATNQDEVSDIDEVVMSVVQAVEEESKSDQERIANAFDRANVDTLNDDVFRVPEKLSTIPVAKRDLVTVKIEQVDGDDGLAFIDGYKIRVTDATRTEECDIRIQHTHADYADAIRLTDQYQPPALQ